MASISEFRSEIAGGVQRQNKWQVTIPFPAFAGDGNDSRTVSILARTTKTPDFTIGEIEIPYFGRTLYMAGDRVYDPIDISFIGTTAKQERDAFERWVEAFNGSDSNTATAGPLSDKLADIQIDLLDEAGAVVKSYTLVSAWPQNMIGYDLDATSADTLAEYTVTFRYDNLSSNTSR